MSVFTGIVRLLLDGWKSYQLLGHRDILRNSKAAELCKDGFLERVEYVQWKIAERQMDVAELLKYNFLTL